MTLKNARHERFAQLLAEGRSQADAYREVYPVSRRWKSDSIHVRASKVSAKVLPRVRELQQAIAARVVMERAEALSILADILRSAPADVKSCSRFAQEMRVNPVTGEVTIRLPSKIAAFAELAKALGWYAPQKVEGEFSFQPDSTVFRALQKAAGHATR